MAVIRCRARLTKLCYGLRGISEEVVYPDGDQREDRTYSPASNTVVCDWCYDGLPFATLSELDKRVAAARGETLDAEKGG